MRGESGRKLGAGVGWEAWGPFPLPLHTQLGLAPKGEWEVNGAQALPHCNMEGGGGEESGRGPRSP